MKPVPHSREKKSDEDAAPSTIRRRKCCEKRKAALVEQLGGKCVECESTEDLTFDHIHGRDWKLREVHSTKRLRIYIKEAAEGKLQLLCRGCNSRKGRPPGETDEVPYGQDDEPYIGI